MNKTLILIVLICLVFVISAEARSYSRSRSKSTAVSKIAKIKKIPDTPSTPQWSCPRLKKVNQKCKEDLANKTKCMYLECIYTEVIRGYQIPDYPQCYAEMDGECITEVSTFEEKKNIKTFQLELEIWCTKGGQYDDFLSLLAIYEKKFDQAFTTGYWQCIKAKAEVLKDAQTVPLPTWPAPFVDVLNYVCQGYDELMRNAERIAFVEFFTHHDEFEVFQASSLKGIFLEVAKKLNHIDTGIATDLKTCLLYETKYFYQSLIQELERHESVATGEQLSDPAYLQIYDGEWYGISMAADEDKGDDYFQVWNQLAPQKHYNVNRNGSEETSFDGNRGHPLCPREHFYIPLTMYGPVCCPSKARKSFDCGQQSAYEAQHQPSPPPQTKKKCGRGRSRRVRACRRKARAAAKNAVPIVVGLPNTAACFGCVCLSGFSMNIDGDYWDQANPLGSCEEDY